ncbi:tetratricopeptide repeat protein [Sphingomonas solaris]|uniref:Tetratricopeptide repeat protein n=1 Tax=Alterirhizorhabdus solaris TaxID=2529389 RepID=A0A558QX52_9SPHN|nr:hypothetical protein [Sphingomonas solaris]TVV71743.1 hypothetical protein FOY91_16050 [Sphingomonas solaris]
MKRLGLRYGLLILVLAAISGAIAWFGSERPGAAIRPYPKVETAVSGAQADAEQQGVPTNYAQALAALDIELAAARRTAAARPGEWLAVASPGDVLLARARLTNSFDDYAEAGRWYDRASAIDPRVGPALQRATWNFAVHRLAAVAPDLDRIDAYVVPDAGEQASATGLRGDLDFYRGNYAAALDRYERSHGRIVTVGTAFRLANYWARMGDAAKANAYLDEAESRLRGPQQQQRAFLEMHRGIIAYQAGQWDEAGAHYARAATIFPGHWLTEEHLATVLALKGDTKRAMALYRSIARRTGMPEAYDAVAGLYRAQGDLTQSQAWAAKAGAGWAKRLALLPEAAYGHALDHELAFGSDPARALAIAERNYANRPFAESATGLASAYMVNRRPADALRVLAPVLASGWVSAEPWIVATEAYAITGQTARADEARKRALAINPHSFDRNPGLVWLEH